MISFAFFTVLTVLAVAAIIWAIRHAGRIRADAKAREVEALALVRAGKDPFAEANKEKETDFDDLLPSRLPASSGVEVADVTGVVDIDALLQGESLAVAERARARLEALTNIHTGVHTGVHAGGPDSLPPRPTTSPPPMQATTSKPVVSPPRPATVPSVVGGDVPLRQLTLAWFEARGYRSAPASPAVRPIEMVLRHKADPSRAYAFVVEPKRIDGSRVSALLNQARSIGLVRLLIVADAGAEPNSAEGKKGVRLMDRLAIEREFKKLDVSVAAKIIAVARKRAASAA